MKIKLRSPIFRSGIILSSLFAIGALLYGQAGSETAQLASVRADGTQANAQSFPGTFSANNRYICFGSLASNLVDGDTNNVGDVFTKDLDTGIVRLVSCTSSGTPGNDFSNAGANSLSSDGRYVVFSSLANNLVSGDTNGFFDVFVKDLSTGEVRRVSTSASGTQGNAPSNGGQISHDGRYVAFTSAASNLVAGDTNSQGDIFIKDLTTGQVTLASTSSGGTLGNSASNTIASLSGDGRYVAFRSWATNLVLADTNGMTDIFVKDLQTGQTVRANVAADGTQGNGDSYLTHSLSSNGRYVAFTSAATNLVPGYVPEGDNGFGVYVKDLETGSVVAASTALDGTPANRDCRSGTISADGRYVTFYSTATNLVANPTNDYENVYAKDLVTGTIKLMSVSLTGSGGNGTSSASGAPSTISMDGRYVCFDSGASDLTAGDQNGVVDTFYKSTGFGSPLPTSLGLVVPVSYIGKSTTVVAILRNKTTLDPVAGESVRFLLDGTKVADIVTGSDGKAKFLYVPKEGTAVGTHRMQARFFGSSNFAASANSKWFEVQKGPVRVQVANKSSLPGKTILVSAKLMNSTGAVLPGRSVAFFVNGVSIGSAVTNSNGIATKSYTVPTTSGSYPIKADFAGDDSYTSGSGNSTLTVN